MYGLLFLTMYVVRSLKDPGEKQGNPNEVRSPSHCTACLLFQNSSSIRSSNASYTPLNVVYVSNVGVELASQKSKCTRFRQMNFSKHCDSHSRLKCQYCQEK